MDELVLPNLTAIAALCMPLMLPCSCGLGHPPQPAVLVILFVGDLESAMVLPVVFS